MTIKELLNAKEGENIEFKEAKDSFSRENLLKYACAIANCGGGMVVLGVTDKRPRKIVGTNAFRQPEETVRYLIDHLHINITFELYEEPSGRVLIFLVSPRPIGLPVQVDGIAYRREADVLIVMTEDEKRRIYEESGHDFSGDVCPGATLDDLNEHSIDEFRKYWAEKSRNSRLKSVGDEQLLRDCEALRPDGITYAALILFGTHEALGRFLPQSETVFEYRSNNSTGPAQQRLEFREGFFSYYNTLWERINARNEIQHYQEGLFIFDVPTFHERVIREAFLNAVSHRNYQLSGSVFVVQYKDRMVIDSPGGFPPGINLENILDRQSPRNRRIAEILGKCGLVERSGQGMNLIYEYCVKESKELPDFSGTDDYLVRLTLSGLVLDKNILLLMKKMGDATLEQFTTNDFLVLNHLFKEEKIPSALTKNAQRLCGLGVIEKMGRNQYILSQRYYISANRAGIHTRKKGLDRNYRKELLADHLKKMGEKGAPFSDFIDVLPGHSRGQIRGLLEELRQKGFIFFRGKTKNARWYWQEERNE